MRQKILVGLVCTTLLFLSVLCHSVSSSSNDDFFITWSVEGFPVVVTNASSNVEETMATLHGFLVSDGFEPCLYAFDYDVVTGEPYAFSTVWAGPVSSPFVFSQNVGLLTAGELYFFRAKAMNSNGTEYGDELRFLTKPYHPTNFRAERNGIVTQIDLSWDIGVGASRTVIVRKVGSYPSDRNDGMVVYNGTSSMYDDGDVVAGVHYYYRAWSYVGKGGLFQFSNEFDEDNCLALEPAIFDLRDIRILDDFVPNLRISVEIWNLGGILADITVHWVLHRVDTGAVLDMGADTIGVHGYTEVEYVIFPHTSYVGDVIITFSGDGVLAYRQFTTRMQPSGWWFAPPAPPTPPPVPDIPYVPPVAVRVWFDYPVFFVLISLLIVVFLFLIIIWRRRKDEDE